MRLRIGVLTRTHGLAGGLRLALDSEAVPAISLPADGWVGFSESFLSPLRLLRFDAAGGDPIVYFDGIGSHEQAARLVDNAFFLPEEAVTYDNPYSDPRVVGYTVEGENGETLGTIGGIIRTPGHYVWSVENDGREWMLPAVEPFIVRLQHEERRATVRVIPGLVDEEPDDERPESA